MISHLAALFVGASGADHLAAALNSAAVIACGLLAAYIWRALRRDGAA